MCRKMPCNCSALRLCLGSPAAPWYEAVPFLQDVSVMPTPSSLTERVARFVVATKSRNIPANVMHLGKRSILDGLGLALAGNRAESGRLVRSYLKTLGLRNGS